ncbi:MAG: hypothetical protein AAGE84_01990 [Cyanobacteria bacterium P01_G01_bin.39]
MTFDTEQIYKQLNESISIGVEELIINKLNKIYSLDSNIEVAKAFIAEILDSYQQLSRAINTQNASNVFQAYYTILESTENILKRHSDILNNDAIEMIEIRWFISCSKSTIQGFEVILNSFKQSEMISFLEEFYNGLDLIVRVLEDSVLTYNYFYLNTSLGILIHDFIIIAPEFVEKKINQFKGKSYNTSKFIYWQRLIFRALASATDTLSSNNASETTRESTIKELYPDQESYKYMETQGQLFDKSLPKLNQKYRDMYVHFEDGKVLDYDQDEDTLIDRVLENNNYQDVFIEKVS